MPGKPPYFPFYPNDFSADGKVEAMSTTEVGAYILLLCKAWMEEPPGTLPVDDRVLARWARMDPERWAEVRRVVLSPFVASSDGRLHQKRMIAEYQKFRSTSKARSSAAKSRWEKEKRRGEGDEGKPPDAIALQLQCNGHAKVYGASGSEYESGSEQNSHIPSSSGGSGGREKNAPSPAPYSEDAADLAGRWCFLYRGTVNGERDSFQIAAAFQEWLDKLGLGCEPLRCEIERKGRDRTEPSWAMKDRLMKGQKGRDFSGLKEFASRGKGNADARQE